MNTISADMPTAQIDTGRGGIYGTPRYYQIIKGWSGAGFESSYRSIEGCFVASGDVANISFDVIDTKKGRRYSHMGSIVLSRDLAIKLAIDLLPPELKDVVIEAQKNLEKS